MTKSSKVWLPTSQLIVVPINRACQQLAVLIPNIRLILTQLVTNWTESDSRTQLLGDLSIYGEGAPKRHASLCRETPILLLKSHSPNRLDFVQQSQFIISNSLKQVNALFRSEGKRT